MSLDVRILKAATQPEDAGVQRSTALGGETSSMNRRGFTRVLGKYRAVRDAIVAWHRRNVTIRELETLDDRLLRDIGLERNTIRETVDSLLEVPRRFSDTSTKQAVCATGRRRTVARTGQEEELKRAA